MADPLLEGNYPQKCLYQALAIAAICLQEEADTRPLMADVVTALEFLATPLEEKKPTVISTENIHYVDSVTGGNVKEEWEAKLYSNYAEKRRENMEFLFGCGIFYLEHVFSSFPN